MPSTDERGVPVTTHHNPTADYFLIVTPKKRRLWQWQIQRRPPTGARLYGKGFKTELEARIAGENALRALVSLMTEK